MTSAVINGATNFKAYVEDISHLTSHLCVAAVAGTGILGDRIVIWLQNISMIIKSPESLRYTIRALISIVNAVQLYISVQISDKVIQVATTILTAVAAWKVGMTVKYFYEGTHEQDYELTKICTIVTEVFYCMARVVVTGAWLVEQGIIPLAVCAATIGSIPVIGATLFAMGSTLFINSFFVVGFFFLFIDRSRAALNGGFVNQAEERAKTQELYRKAENTCRNGIRGPFTEEQALEFERQMALFIEAKNKNRPWVAWADVTNLIGEAALLILTLTPLSFNLLGVIACSAGVTSCVWNIDPEPRPQIAL